MQNRMENARRGYVSVVQETLGIHLSRQQSKYVDAEQLDIADGPLLQEHADTVGQQCCKRWPNDVAVRGDWGWRAKLQYATEQSDGK